jgi:transcriptional regulator with XRE-family HTH domain
MAEQNKIQTEGGFMDAKKIAERLVTLRGNRTQAEVAQAIGVSPSAYSMYENGERIPRDEVKKRIAAYYKRSVSTIFFAD